MERDGYQVTNLSEETRQVLADVMVLLKGDGYTAAAAIRLLQKKWPELKPSTAYRYVKRIKDGEPVISPSKATGAARTLTDEQLAVLIGRALLEKKGRRWICFRSF